MTRRIFALFAPDEGGGLGGSGGGAGGGSGSSSGGGGSSAPASSGPTAPAPAAMPSAAFPGGSQGTPGPTAPQAPAAPAGQQSVAAPGAAQQFAVGAGAPAAGAAAAQQAAQMESIREVVARLGGTDLVNQFADDTSLLQHLLLARQQAQQREPLAKYGERVVDRWGEVQKLLEQPAPGAAPAGPAEPWYKPWFNPPAYDPAWEKQIIKGADGQLHAAPGAPPDVVQRYAQYQQFKGQMVDKLVSNPFEFFEPAIKHLARQEAQQIAREQIAATQDAQFANQFVHQNQDWLWAKDQQGQTLRDPVTQQPMLTEWGTRFRDYAASAQQAGVKDLRIIQQLALKQVQADFLLAQQQAGLQQQQAAAAAPPQQANGQQLTPAQQQQQAANQQFLQGAMGGNRMPNSGPAPAVPGQIQQNTQGLSLQQRLRNKFVAAGVNVSDQV